MVDLNKTCPVKDLTTKEIYHYLEKLDLTCTYCQDIMTCPICNGGTDSDNISCCPSYHDEIAERVKNETREYIVEGFKEDIAWVYGESASLNDFEKNPIKITLERKKQLALLEKLQREDLIERKEQAINFFEKEYDCEWKETKYGIFISSGHLSILSVGIEELKKAGTKARVENYSCGTSIKMLEDFLGILHLYYLGDKDGTIEKHSKEWFEAHYEEVE